MEERPDPDQILRNNFPENRAGGRGRLKIFFGYAAGVGKTYAMLDGAREAMEAGRSVTAAYIEPHDRPETLALLEGLEILPPRIVEYKGIKLREMDLDGVLIRRPELALVDELAHTNAPGCRHKKRYQDVIELLDAGIDVYTTVNVQHLESLHDIVASITHVQVGERIPDSIFDQADQVELVDIAPEELRRRLDEGKIYHQDQAGKAVRNFFTAENLSALREIALRRTADRVNREVARERESGGREYYTCEHVLVCLSPSPTNARVIRTAARMAGAFHGDLTAILVETAHIRREHEGISAKMQANINLAKQFGANVITLYGEDIVDQIAGYARRNGISKIVIGRTVQKPHLFYVRPTLIDRLIKRLPTMDVYVIPDSGAQARKQQQVWRKFLGGGSRADYFKTALAMAGATVLSMILDHFQAGPVNVVMAYIMGVILVAYMTTGKRCGVIASAASVLLFNYFFTNPRYTLQADASIYPFTFAAMLFCALVTSRLAGRLKEQAVISEAESRYMQILLNAGRSFRKGKNVGEVLAICGSQVHSLLGRSIVVYDTTGGCLGSRQVFAAQDREQEARTLFARKDEEAVAAWVLKNRHKAGRTTDTLPGAQARYIPVFKDQTVYAVMGIEMAAEDEILPNDKNVLNIIAQEASFRLKDLQGRV